MTLLTPKAAREAALLRQGAITADAAAALLGKSKETIFNWEKAETIWLDEIAGRKTKAVRLDDLAVFLLANAGVRTCAQELKFKILTGEPILSKAQQKALTVASLSPRRARLPGAPALALQPPARR